MKKIFCIIPIVFLFFVLPAQKIQVYQFPENDSVLLKIDADENIQWQESVSLSSWTDITGANTNEYIFKPGTAKYYRAILSGQNCENGYTDTAYVSSFKVYPENLDSVEIKQLINLCYLTLRTWFGKEIGYKMSELGTDIFTAATESLTSPFTTYSTALSANSELMVAWNELYKGVINCNAAVHYISGSGLSEKLQDEAEIRFLRAFYLWNIVETWGGTVFVTGWDPLLATDYYIAPADTFYNQIFRDLDFAAQNLPVHQPSNTRLNQSAAHALLARIYLSKKNYTLALNNAMQVINSMNYSLLADYGQLWDISNSENAEVIFALDNTIYPDPLVNFTSLNAQPNSNYWIPGQQGHLVWEMSYDQFNGIKRSVEYGRPWRRFCPTRFYTDLFDETNDKRFYGSFKNLWLCNDSSDIPLWPDNIYINGIEQPVDVSLVGKRRFNYGDTALVLYKDEVSISEKAYTNSSGTGYAFHPVSGYFILDIDDLYDAADNPKDRKVYFPITKKFMDSTRLTVDETYSSRNIYILRYAEIYLIAAEANYYLGILDEAYSLLEALAASRSVYGNGQSLLLQYGINSGNDITIDFLLDERARELGAEQLRWYDLKRTGKLVERVQLHNNDAAPNIQSFHNLRPLPMDIATGKFGNIVVQNPNY